MMIIHQHCHSDHIMRILSIKCRIDHTAKWRQKIVTMEQYQTGCDLSWLAICDFSRLVICDFCRLVIDIIFTSHPSYLWHCWTIDNLQNGKIASFLRHILSPSARYNDRLGIITWYIGNCCHHWQIFFTDPGLPMSVLPRGTYVFINYSGQLYLKYQWVWMHVKNIVCLFFKYISISKENWLTKIIYNNFNCKCTIHET